MQEMIVGAIAEKAAEMAISGIVTKLSRIRAERFYAGLVEGLRTGEVSNEDAAYAITNAIGSKAKSEVIYEAYRRVCLSASRDLGPTLIGLITARLLAEDRTATDCEERLLMAAEALSDSELRELESFLQEATKEDVPPGWGLVHVYTFKEHVDSRFPRDVEIGPADLAACLGVWALKCHGLGIVRQTVRAGQTPVQEDGERYIDSETTVTTYTWRISVLTGFLTLLPLLSSANRNRD